jgi:hypothetical protein
VLGVAGAVPIDSAPARHRAALRAYLAQGVLPEGALQAVLEGDLGAAIQAGERHGQRVSATMALWTWVQAQLPACCHGNRDQVQLWLVYLRRARGRALLAAMEAST